MGLFVGTYSSVYLASPLLIWMGVNSDSFVPKETETDKQEKKVLEGQGGSKPIDW